MSLEPQPCLVGLDCVKVTTTSKQNIELHSYLSGFNVVADQCTLGLILVASSILIKHRCTNKVLFLTQEECCLY